MPHETPPSPPLIPSEYGVTKIVALVRDPWWAYAYWEVTPGDLSAAHQRCGEGSARLTLRVYDLTAGEDFSVFWDIGVYERIGNWYIDLGGLGRGYCLEIGVKSSSDQFFAMARSNGVATPPTQISDDLSEEWWTLVDPIAAAAVSAAAVSAMDVSAVAVSAVAVSDTAPVPTEDWWIIRDFGVASVSYREEGRRLSLHRLSKRSRVTLAHPPSSFLLHRREGI